MHITSGQMLKVGSQDVPMQGANQTDKITAKHVLCVSRSSGTYEAKCKNCSLSNGH